MAIESSFAEQHPPTPYPPARRTGRRVGRAIALVLIGAILLAGFFLTRRGLPAAAIVPPVAPVAQIEPVAQVETSAQADPVVAHIPAASIAEIEQAPAPETAQVPVALPAADTTSPAETTFAAADLFPVLGGLAATADDWLVAREMPPSEDPENPALGGALAFFSLQPLGAPCCSLPTSDKAVDAALSLPGVLAAKVNESGTLLVRYDPAQVAPGEIASTVNRASFLVEAVEAEE